MSRIIATIDAIINVLEVFTGHRPRAGFWMNVERSLIAVIAVAALTLVCVFVVLNVLN